MKKISKNHWSKLEGLFLLINRIWNWLNNQEKELIERKGKRLSLSLSLSNLSFLSFHLRDFGGEGDRSIIALERTDLVTERMTKPEPVLITCPWKRAKTKDLLERYKNIWQGSKRSILAEEIEFDRGANPPPPPYFDRSFVVRSGSIFRKSKSRQSSLPPRPDHPWKPVIPVIRSLSCDPGTEHEARARTRASV